MATRTVASVASTARVGERCGACGQPMGRWAVDRLTGLLDRWGWDEEALSALDRTRRQGQPIALIMIDLDYFKGVNDEFGHLAGDAVLRSAADVVHAATRTGDVVGRYGGHGGDEFLALLPGRDLAAASTVAEEIRRGIKGVLVRIQARDGALVSIAGRTASIGVSGAVDVRDLTVLDLLRRADEALWEAKLAGRDQIFVAQAC